MQNLSQKPGKFLFFPGNTSPDAWIENFRKNKRYLEEYVPMMNTDML